MIHLRIRFFLLYAREVFTIKRKTLKATRCATNTFFDAFIFLFIDKRVAVYFI